MTGAGSVAGIPGAVFGVPIAAFVNATFLYLHGYDPLPELARDPERAGGPPGELAQMLAATYAGMALVAPSPEGVTRDEDAPAPTAGGADAGAGRPGEGSAAPSRPGDADAPR